MMPAMKQFSGPLLQWLLEGMVRPELVPDLEVHGLHHDSRAIEPGDVFIALPGSRVHGMRHLAQAVDAGAVAVVYDPAGGGAELAREEARVPCISVERLSQRLGLIADRFFGEPSKDLQIIGITGTNGKTSCSHFIAEALCNRRPAAVIGTLGWGAPGQLEPTQHTTPDAIEVHSILDSLRRRSYKWVAMEASSHGLEQGRMNGVRLQGALFTNLSRDHLDYHGTMEQYLEAKLRLMRWPDLLFAAINLDDDSADAAVAAVPTSVRKIGFTRSPGREGCVHGVDVLTISDVVHDSAGLAFRAHFGGLSIPVHVPVFGDFNVENLAGTLSVLLGLGHSLAMAARRLEQIRPVPGRMERFIAPIGPAVVVDYAHTPDALEKTLSSLRNHCAGKLWVVFGCGGDRDRGKRPQMGAIANALADRIVVTDDNPRSEDGDAIVADVLEGCSGSNPHVRVIRDREQAIAYAIDGAGEDDVVLVAGKGHESTQEVRGVKHEFSDRAVVQRLLANCRDAE